jgi:hypothetical protein
MAWYVCAVNEVGPGADGTETSSPVIYINLTDTEKSFSNTWFYAADGIKDYLLDVGIAAVSGNKYVEVAAYPPKPGNSPYTEITRIYERAPIWQPEAPTNLHVINVLPVAGDASSITVGWTDNSDNEAGFRISTYGYSEGQDNKYGETTVQDNVQTATLTGLTSGYTYDITVAAFNAAGQSKGMSVTAAIPYVPPVVLPPATATISAGVQPISDPVGSPFIYKLVVQGQNFRHGEDVQVVVTWGLRGQQQVRQPLPPVQTDPVFGAFKTTFEGSSGLGFCYGTGPPVTYTFAVEATGIQSGLTVAATAQFTC